MVVQAQVTSHIEEFFDQFQSVISKLDTETNPSIKKLRHFLKNVVRNAASYILFKETGKKLTVKIINKNQRLIKFDGDIMETALRQANIVRDKISELSVPSGTANRIISVSLGPLRHLLLFKESFAWLNKIDYSSAHADYNKFLKAMKLQPPKQKITSVVKRSIRKPTNTRKKILNPFRLNENAAPIQITSNPPVLSSYRNEEKPKKAPLTLEAPAKTDEAIKFLKAHGFKRIRTGATGHIKFRKGSVTTGFSNHYSELTLEIVKSINDAVRRSRQ